MFGLLQTSSPEGRVQGRMWAYWEFYELHLPVALRDLLDSILHPVPEKSFSMEQAFAWTDSHSEMFNAVQNKL